MTTLNMTKKRTHSEYKATRHDQYQTDMEARPSTKVMKLSQDSLLRKPTTAQK